MNHTNSVSECPECGADVKSQLDLSHDLSFSKLTESDINSGEYFHCIICEIAWESEKREPCEFPMMSSSPSGMLEPVSSGKDIEDTVESNFRLLGYGDDNTLILRDVGDLAFARDESNGIAHPEKLQSQLGDLIEVVRDGYPNTVQKTLNALRPGYCINATVGTPPNNETLEFDAQTPCRVAEAVPVEYAINTEFVPDFAQRVWDEDFTGAAPEGDIPQARRTLHNNQKPAADVYVFPKHIEDQHGVPLIAGMQRGHTHHIEKFTTNFTGVFTGGVIDVLFILPEDRPYFAVYCLGNDCIELSHELRADLGLPVVNRGWEADRTQIFDIRYNPKYVERRSVDGNDTLVSTENEDGVVDIESGNVTGEYFSVSPEPHELVVTIPSKNTGAEVARLRAPTARVNKPVK